MEQTIKTFTTYRLVKSEDLNHHKTLFAGRGAEWFVEAGYIAATSMVNPENLVCAKIHGMRFDTGDWAEYLTANIYFALQEEELRDDLIRHLRPLLPFG